MLWSLWSQEQRRAAKIRVMRYNISTIRECNLVFRSGMRRSAPWSALVAFVHCRHQELQVNPTPAITG